MRFDLPRHISGETWSGVSSMVLVSGQNSNIIDLTDCDIYINFKLPNNIATPVVFVLSTENSTINIVDASDGEISIPKQIINIPSAVYNYSMQVKFPDGDIKTVVQGTLEVAPSIWSTMSDLPIEDQTYTVY
jgi:hypothetical protein